MIDKNEENKDLEMSDEEYQQALNVGKKEQQVGEQLSFGIDLSKKVEKKDMSKELNVQKTLETPKVEKVVEAEKVKEESVIPMSERLPKEDWIRQKRQEERLRDLERRGMYNSFENGVSGDPDYDFDEFD